MIALLVKQCREQPESRVLDLESVAALGYPAFAQNDDLLSPSESIHNHCPFFERGAHSQADCYIKVFIWSPIVLI